MGSLSDEISHDDDGDNFSESISDHDWNCDGTNVEGLNNSTVPPVLDNRLFTRREMSGSFYTLEQQFALQRHQQQYIQQPQQPQPCYPQNNHHPLFNLNPVTQQPHNLTQPIMHHQQFQQIGTNVNNTNQFHNLMMHQQQQLQQQRQQQLVAISYNHHQSHQPDPRHVALAQQQQHPQHHYIQAALLQPTYQQVFYSALPVVHQNYVNNTGSRSTPLSVASSQSDNNGSVTADSSMRGPVSANKSIPSVSNCTSFSHSNADIADQLLSLNPKATGKRSRSGTDQEISSSEETKVTPISGAQQQHQNVPPYSFNDQCFEAEDSDDLLRSTPLPLPPMPSILSHMPTRFLSKEEKQKLSSEAADLTRQLMRIYSILDLDAMLLVVDFKERGQVVERKYNSAEMLIASQEIVENAERDRNHPLKLASDIYHGKRTIFAKYERPLGSFGSTTSTSVHSSPSHTNPRFDGQTTNGKINITNSSSLGSSNDSGGSIADPYRSICVRHDIPRGEIIRDIGSMYTSMYKKSHTNSFLSIKEATIGQVEDILRSYYRDGYKLSPGILSYLTSHVSERKDNSFLTRVEGDPALKHLQPLCWDTQNVPFYLKSTLYKMLDKRSSEEAKMRARNLTLQRKLKAEANPGEIKEPVLKSQPKLSAMKRAKKGKTPAVVHMSSLSQDSVDVALAALTDDGATTSATATISATVGSGSSDTLDDVALDMDLPEFESEYQKALSSKQYHQDRPGKGLISSVSVEDIDFEFDP